MIDLSTSLGYFLHFCTVSLRGAILRARIVMIQQSLLLLWMLLSIVIRRFSATAWITLRLIEIYGESLLGCGQSYLLLIITIVWTFGFKRAL